MHQRQNRQHLSHTDSGKNEPENQCGSDVLRDEKSIDQLIFVGQTPILRRNGSAYDFRVIIP
jgi:hypothetical protein